MGVTRNLAQQTALADARLAFDQDCVSGTGGEPRNEPDEHAVLVIPADEGCGIARRRVARTGRGRFRFAGPGGVRAGADRRGLQPQTVRGVQRTRGGEEIAPLLLGYGKRRHEPFSEPPRRAALVGLDLSDGETRAADPLAECFLGEIQRFAPPPQPVTKRMCPILQVVRPSAACEALESSSFVRDFVPVFVPLWVTTRTLSRAEIGMSIGNTRTGSDDAPQDRVATP